MRSPMSRPPGLTSPGACTTGARLAWLAATQSAASGSSIAALLEPGETR